MEARAGQVESDPNDQVVVGTYRTRNFEQSEDAQRLYSNLPKNTPPDAAERAAILHDKLLGIHKNAVSTGRSTSENMEAASSLLKNIKKLAADMKLTDEHNYLDRILTDLNKRLEGGNSEVNKDTLNIEKINDRFASPSKEQTKEKPDHDIDNSKFLIRRNLKAQRKIKIIDAD